MRLGYLQQHMINFVRMYANGDRQRFFHIARDRETRRVAKSLEKKGLIRITNTAYECWVIALA